MLTDLLGTPTPISQLCTFLIIYDWNSVCRTPVASYGLTSGMEWRQKLSIPLSYAHWFIRNSHPNITTVHILIIYDWNSVCRTPVASYGLTIRNGMTSKIEYPTILCSLMFFRNSHPNSTTVQILNIYDWSGVCRTPVASYGLTSGMEWRRKLSIPLSYAHWFIRNSHPNITTVHIL